ncbi:hypothetical protein GCM10009555_106920 [Acrocarpospora macrocephala]|uniref:Uncharacterized protein n=2 Tax=Acrocarpospora macrocephala TaxID=150177 RepID=A0A5M3X1H1_9ACTN|nr:hypothetical protein Amac_086010 [Acrocarpospora macrocephala]
MAVGNQMNQESELVQELSFICVCDEIGRSPEEAVGTHASLCGQVNQAAHWERLGDYRRAGLILSAALDSAESQEKQNPLIVARICNRLGVLGKYTGQFQLSEAYYLRALEICQSVYGGEHDSVAGIYHNLAGLAHAKGDYEIGDSWARKGIDIRTRLLGPGHPSVVADIGAWAALLYGCGRLDDAEAELRYAVKMVQRRNCHGRDAADLATHLHNLAAVRQCRGDLVAAIDGYRHALTLMEDLRGPDHPDLATTLVNLASSCIRLNRADEALEYYRRAIDILGPQVEEGHPTLLAAKNGIAGLENES